MIRKSQYEIFRATLTITGNFCLRPLKIRTNGDPDMLPQKTHVIRHLHPVLESTSIYKYGYYVPNKFTNSVANITLPAKKGFAILYSFVHELKSVNYQRKR